MPFNDTRVPVSIVYVTCRKDPKFYWFLASLKNELKGDYSWVEVIIVDFWKETRSCRVPIRKHLGKDCRFIHTPPKPSVWQGSNRLTKENYFAAANARNTGIAFAQYANICFVDDLSVLVPGWFDKLQEGLKQSKILLGVYGKGSSMVVKKGIIEKAVVEGPNNDHRIEILEKRHGEEGAKNWNPCTGDWLFGCCFAMPLDYLLDCNGLDENSDSEGSEDALLGAILERRHGDAFRISTAFKILEAHDEHFDGHVFHRQIKKRLSFDRKAAYLAGNDSAFTPEYIAMRTHHHGPPEQWEWDSSHEMLYRTKYDLQTATVNANYFPEGGLRDLRDRVLVEGYDAFPKDQIPQHDWRDGQPLSEM